MPFWPSFDNHYTHKKIRTAPKMFGTVPVNFGDGTPNLHAQKNRHDTPNSWHRTGEFWARHSFYCKSLGTSAKLFFVTDTFYTSIIGSAVPKIHRYGTKHLGCRADFFVRVNGV